MRHIKFVIVLTAMCSFLSNARATDRYYSDITVESPSKQYRVDAKSPDNAKTEGYRAFQRDFLYTCTNTTTDAVLWTRKQSEGSPIQVFVSDSGWTVIRTAGDGVLSVDLEGHDHCNVSLLSGMYGSKTGGAFTEEDMKHVQYSTAGPMWSSNSLWYFLDVSDQHLFIVRTWWGRNVVMNIASGKVLDETAEITTAMKASERKYILTELAKGLTTRKQWEVDGCGNPNSSGTVWPVLKAAYLAGSLQVKEAIPMLEQLQDARYVGGSSMSLGDMGGMIDQGVGVKKKGRVSPTSYSTYDVRQVVQLSLRRLGKTPRSYPVTIFNVQYDDYTQNHPYHAKVLSGPRFESVDKAKIGMLPEDVLDLLGAPDFVGFQGWEYDMDGDEPFTFILKWDRKTPYPENTGLSNEESFKLIMEWQKESPVVSEIQKSAVPYWQEGSMLQFEMAGVMRDYLVNQ